jgi:protein-S-isoprenylcysteine O-methyltransferase Ste14
MTKDDDLLARWPIEKPVRAFLVMDREAFRTLLFRHREAVLVLLSVPVIVAALRGGGIAPTSALLGAGVAATGVLLRLYAAREIGRGARVFHAHARGGMVSSGPYRWTRNPLYLAAGLMLCGLGSIAGAGWKAVALLPATLLAYTPVVLIEERALTALFGDAYQRYLIQVPRWIGFRRPYGGEPESTSVGWREVLDREKGLVPGVLFAILGIAATRSEWLPFAQLARWAQRATGLDLEVLVASAAVIAVFVNAAKVELHQRRRYRARRAARSHHTA